MALNSDVFYQRVFDAKDDVVRDADDALREVLEAGWVLLANGAECSA